MQAAASASDAARAAGATAGSGVGSLRTAEGSPAAAGKGGMSQAPGPGAHGGEGSKQEKASTTAQLIKLECSKEIIEEDLLREIEDLRSENEYLKVKRGRGK